MRNGMLIDWATAGALLAAGDDNDQAEFFKSFAKEVQTYPTHHQQEIQMCFINKKLTEDERALFATIGLLND